VNAASRPARAGVAGAWNRGNSSDASGTQRPHGMTFLRSRSVLVAAGAAVLASRATVAQHESLPPPAPTVSREHSADPVSLLDAIDVGLNLLAAVGASTARDEELALLAGGAHDPAQRGFTLRQAELSLAGRIADQVEAKAFLVASLAPAGRDGDEGETVVELEEAYAQTVRRDGQGFQVRAGTYFTEFGVRNAQHPHAWQWLNQPVVLTRLCGGDGMRGPGARLGWRSEGGVDLVLGVQNAHGETMPSFLGNDEVYEERGVGGRQRAAAEVRSAGDVLVSARAAVDAFASADATCTIGASAATGPNATGGDASTWLAGVDVHWRAPCPAHRDHAFAPWSLTAEWAWRSFDAEAQIDASDPLAPVALPEERLVDHGGFVEGLVAVHDAMAIGLRGEWVTGSGASYRGGGAFARADDPWRCDRLRVSPLVALRLAPGVGLRLQLDHDDSDAAPGTEQSVWLGVEVLLGSHGSRHHGHSL
jgi:hypothetical protein